MATKTVILADNAGETLVDIAAEDVTANVTARDAAPTRSNVPTRATVPSRSTVPTRPVGY